MKAGMTPAGSLVLLGSEGAEATFAPVWKELLAGKSGPVELLCLPAATPSMVYLGRLDEIEAHFKAIGMTTRRRGLDEPGEIGSGCVVIASAQRAHFTEGDKGEIGREMIARKYREILGAGAMLIAGATTAAGIGERLAEVERPLPPDPDSVALSAGAGLGLVTGAVLLPYFDRIEPGTLARLMDAYRGMPALIGIDQDAALVIEPGGARCTGLGKVTLLRDNEVSWVGGDGDALPPGLIAMNLH